MSPKLGIIGGGNMGAAIVRGCIAAGVLKPGDFIIAEIDDHKRHQLEALDVAVSPDSSAVIAADQILLAIKPQVFPDVAKAIGPLPASKIVISIMAGPNSTAIRRALGGKVRVLRAMPNMACQIGSGMTAIARGAGAQEGDETLVLSVFNAMGKTVLVDESLIPAVTAISGSGPAYVFSLAEAMEKAALELGFDQPAARLLVEQTIVGSGRLLAETGQGAATLRRAVTSPGGTTAAALKIMDRHDFNRIIVDALTAARDRGIQLDKGED